jgi:hypothetical protein
MWQHVRLYSKARQCPNNRWLFVNIWPAVSQATRTSFAAEELDWVARPSECLARCHLSGLLSDFPLH